jgi:hypothetical protein
MQRSIAKVNARSIDGYFGIGTSCFFIRGTVLSDTQVGGEYLTLPFNRPGNTIELEAFDGIWAVVTITTRAGNRPGDNVRARLYLRDDDLKVLGMDCARIVAHNGMPFSFPVESLAYHGLFEQGEAEPYEPVEDDPPPPQVVAEDVVATVAWVEPEPELLPEPVLHVPEPEPEPAFVAPEPEPEPEPAVAAPEPVVVAAVVDEPVVVLDAMPAEATAQERVDILKLFSALRAGRQIFGGNPLLEIGASVAAVATPVVFYLLLNFLRGKPPEDKH